MGRISSSLSSSNVSYCARKERSGASAQQRERGISEANNRPLAQLRLRRFFGLFWPIFDSFCGGSIRSLIQPPQNESKTRLKRTQKSTEAKLRKRSNIYNRPYLFAEMQDFYTEDIAQFNQFGFCHLFRSEERVHSLFRTDGKLKYIARFEMEQFI